MSWYSDGERFTEHDDQLCIWMSKKANNRCGISKEECDRCMALHEEEEEYEEDVE